MTYLGKYREEVGPGYSTEELFQKMVAEMREKAPGLASVDDEDLREYLGYNEEIYNNSGAGAIVPNLKAFGRGALSLPTTAGMVVTGIGAIGADLVGADETAKRWRSNIRDISQAEEKLQSALGLAPSRAEAHRMSQPLYSSEGGINWLKIGTTMSESAPSIILGAAMGGTAAPVLARTPVFRALGRLATKSKWAKTALGGAMTAEQNTLALATGAGLSLGEGVTSGLQNGKDTYAEVMNAPLSSLQSMENWGTYVRRAGGDIEQARMLFAAEEARRVGVLSGLAVTGTSLALGTFLPTAERVIGREVGKGIFRSKLSKVGDMFPLPKVMSSQAVEEIIQSDFELYISNRSRMKYDKNITPFTGMGETSALGGVTGGTMGGMMGAARFTPIYRSPKNFLADQNEVAAMAEQLRNQFKEGSKEYEDFRKNEEVRDDAINKASEKYREKMREMGEKDERNIEQGVEELRNELMKQWINAQKMYGFVTDEIATRVESGENVMEVYQDMFGMSEEEDVAARSTAERGALPTEADYGEMDTGFTSDSQQMMFNGETVSTTPASPENQTEAIMRAGHDATTNSENERVRRAVETAAREVKEGLDQQEEAMRSSGIEFTRPTPEEVRSLIDARAREIMGQGQTQPKNEALRVSDTTENNQDTILGTPDKSRRNSDGSEKSLKERISKKAEAIVDGNRAQLIADLDGSGVKVPEQTPKQRKGLVMHKVGQITEWLKEDSTRTPEEFPDNYGARTSAIPVATPTAKTNKTAKRGEAKNTPTAKNNKTAKRGEAKNTPPAKTNKTAEGAAKNTPPAKTNKTAEGAAKNTPPAKTNKTVVTDEEVAVLSAAVEKALARSKKKAAEKAAAEKDAEEGDGKPASATSVIGKGLKPGERVQWLPPGKTDSVGEGKGEKQATAQGAKTKEIVEKNREAGAKKPSQAAGRTKRKATNTVEKTTEKIEADAKKRGIKIDEGRVTAFGEGQPLPDGFAALASAIVGMLGINAKTKIDLAVATVFGSNRKAISKEGLMERARLKRKLLAKYKNLKESDIDSALRSLDNNETFGFVVSDDSGGSNTVVIGSKAMSGMGAHTVEVLSHELGHIFIDTEFRNAPKEVQDIIRAEYELWKKGLADGSVRSAIAKFMPLASSMRTLNRVEGRNSELANAKAGSAEGSAILMQMTFKEYLANQIARFMTTDPKAIGRLEALSTSKPGQGLSGKSRLFFSSVAKKLRTLVAAIYGAEFLPQPAVRAFMRGVMDTKVVVGDVKSAFVKGNEHFDDADIKNAEEGYYSESKTEDDVEPITGALQKMALEIDDSMDAFNAANRLYNEAMSDPNKYSEVFSRIDPRTADLVREYSAPAALPRRVLSTLANYYNIATTNVMPLDVVWRSIHDIMKMPVVSKVLKDNNFDPSVIGEYIRLVMQKSRMRSVALAEANGTIRDLLRHRPEVNRKMGLVVTLSSQNNFQMGKKWEDQPAYRMLKAEASKDEMFDLESAMREGEKRFNEVNKIFKGLPEDAQKSLVKSQDVVRGQLKERKERLLKLIDEFKDEDPAVMKKLRDFQKKVHKINPDVDYIPAHRTGEFGFIAYSPRGAEMLRAEQRKYKSKRESLIASTMSINENMTREEAAHRVDTEHEAMMTAHRQELLRGGEAIYSTFDSEADMQRAAGLWRDKGTGKIARDGKPIGWEVQEFIKQRNYDEYMLGRETADLINKITRSIEIGKSPVSRNIVDVDSDTKSEIIHLLREMEMVAATNRARTSFRRQNTLGNSMDYSRKVAEAIYSNAYTTAGVEFDSKIADALQKTREISAFIERYPVRIEEDGVTKDIPPDITKKLGRLLNMVDKHKLKDRLLKESKQTPVMDAIQSYVFVRGLGKISHYIQNATQYVAYTLPAIAAKDDISLMKALKASVVGYKAYAGLTSERLKGGHIVDADGGRIDFLSYMNQNKSGAKKVLGEVTGFKGEKLDTFFEYMSNLIRDNQLQQSQAVAAANVAKGRAPKTKSGQILHTALDVAGFPARESEFMTRFVAATALFESKYTGKGGSVHEKAHRLSREANRIIEDTLFIYEPEFRPMIFKNRLGQVLGMFQSFRIRSLCMISRNFAGVQELALKRGYMTHEEAKYRAKTFAMQMGMSLALTGPLGMLGARMTLGALSALLNALSPDDDNWDLEADFMNGVADVTGYNVHATRFLTRGALGLLPFQINADMSTMLFNDPGEFRPVNTWSDLYDESLLSMGGPVFELFRDAFKATDILTSDNKPMMDRTVDAVRQLAPAQLRGWIDGFKALNNQGRVLDRRGREVIAADPGVYLAYFIGATPTSLKETWTARGQVSAAKQKRQKRISDLRGAFSLAVNMYDTEAEWKVRNKIAEFNRKNPDLAITKKQLELIKKRTLSNDDSKSKIARESLSQAAWYIHTTGSDNL